MDRDEAKKIISSTFDQAADDIPTEQLETMKREVGAQIRALHTHITPSTLIQALETEISARRADPEA